jgi:anthranilate/para-aminobenzoate synthase component II
LAEVKELLNNVQVPTIGICFGAQIIARACGAKIVKLPSLVSGNRCIRIIKNKAAFGNRYLVTVFKKQYWAIQDITDDFGIYGVSSEGIELFINKNTPVAGVQFHPELFCQTTDGPLIFRSVRKILRSKAR